MKTRSPDWPDMWIKGLMILLTSLVMSPVMATDLIGKTVFTRGVVSAQYPEGQVRILSKDSDIFESDVVSTGSNSFTVIGFDNGTRISIRPDTVLSVEAYSGKPQQEQMLMNLFKGGVRAISAYMGRSKPGTLKIKSRAGNIVMRGGRMDARLCAEQECLAGKVAKQGKPRGSSTVDGRVAFLAGSLTATNRRGDVRNLVVGSEVLRGDTLATGAKSYALLAFKDATRASMKAESKFILEAYAFDAAAPAVSKSSFKLLQGGLRTLTGAIGGKNPLAFKVHTAVATIGIRGTGFDLVWKGACSGAGGNCGLIGHVWEGGITSENDAGLYDIGINQTVRIRTTFTAPEFIITPPVFTIPRPDQEDIDMEELFESEQPQNGEEPGDGAEPEQADSTDEEETEPLQAEDTEQEETEPVQVTDQEETEPVQASGTTQDETDPIQAGETMLDSPSEQTVTPGLYVACYEGDCQLSDEQTSIDVGDGEMGFASGDDQPMTVVEEIDTFLAEDTYFATIEGNDFDTITLFEVIEDNVITQNEFDCFVQ